MTKIILITIIAVTFVVVITSSTIDEVFGEEADQLNIGKDNVDTAIIQPQIYPPPLKQVASGVFSEQVICNNTFQKIFKSNGSVACVKPSSMDKLTQRGWSIELSVTTELIPNINTDTDIKENTRSICGPGYYLVGDICDIAPPGYVETK